jgi:hypothetical protein
MSSAPRAAENRSEHDLLLSNDWSFGLRYKEKAIAPGAQTERPGDAGPVRALLGG